MSRRFGAWAEGFLLGELLRSAGYPRVRIAVEDGACAAPPGGEYLYTLRLRDRAALVRMLADAESGFAEEYAQARVVLEGDLAGFCREIYRAGIRHSGLGWVQRLLSWWLDATQAATLRGSWRNVHRHYDLPADFYRLWLDRELVYTCAWFPHPRATLEDAQVAKMERVCRKLALDSGDRVIEAGCGWGALALYMARHFGARVRAFNLSHEQVEYARRRAAREGLSSAVEFIEDDYRNVAGSFDAFVSIGMLEHVGAEHYGELARMLGRWLGVSGRGLLHFIGRTRPEPLSPWIRRRIFPGAYAPALSEALAILEQRDYAVLDVENLRGHYARTLACWRERFEAAEGEVERLFDGEFLRAWRLYLAGSEAAFQAGNLQLFQVLFAGRECRRRLWTREWAPREEPVWIV